MSESWTGGAVGLIREIGIEVEEEIRKVESEVAVGLADKFLEKTRTLRTVWPPSSVHWWQLTQRS